MKKLFILFVFLSGCMASNTYYYETNKAPVKEIVIQEKKPAATFSVSDSDEGGGEDVIKQKKFIKELREKFLKTNLFDSFSYAFFNEKSDYHFHFDVRRTGTGIPLPLGFLSVYTLGIIPASMHSNFDITMFLYVNQKETFSVTAPTTMTGIIWLPFILFSPTAWFAGSNIRETTTDYFIKNIIDNQLYLSSSKE